MKYRPIIMSAESVRAILDGRKTQTRRVVKPQPHWTDPKSCDAGEWYDEFPTIRGGAPVEDIDWRRCPYGVPGDRLYCKEVWKVPHWDGDRKGVTVVYRAGGEQWVSSPYDHVALAQKYLGRKWRSSIYMPRWASRLTLEITDVRVERVQGISEAGARAEGFRRNGRGAGQMICGCVSAVDFYAKAWDSLNAKRGHSWDSNPWVWVVEFRRIEP